MPLGQVVELLLQVVHLGCHNLRLGKVQQLLHLSASLHNITIADLVQLQQSHSNLTSGPDI